ncbi:MAG: hypothetical protein ACI8W8_002051 [Rhodothermales bacterium]|jgi:hypothetical protein
MKQIILILVGASLFVIGIRGSLFWGQAIREAGTIFSAGGVQDEETTREQLPRFAEAVGILGVDIFAPAVEQSMQSAEVLAQKITRGMYTRLALSALAFLLGIAVLFAALLSRNPLSKPVDAVNSGSAGASPR